MQNAEFQERYAGKYLGTYSGVVKHVDDPKQLHRVRATFPQHFGNHEDTLDWAWPSGKHSHGGGWFDMPLEGETVFLTFIDGCIESPIWELGPSGYIQDNNTVSRHFRGEADIEDMGLKGTNKIPKSSFKGEYGKVRGFRTPRGLSIEFDDTDGNERVQIFHPSGTHIEMQADGAIIDVATGRRITHTAGNENVRVTGSKESLVAGDDEEKIAGNKKTEIKGNEDTIVLGGVTYNVSKLEITTKGDHSTSSGGSSILIAEGNREETIGGSRSVSVLSAETKTVTGPVSLSAANVMNVNPLAPSLMMQGFNGRTGLYGTDPTGLAAGGYIDMSFAPPMTKLYSGPAPLHSMQLPTVGRADGSGLLLDGTGAGTVLHSMLNLFLLAKTLLHLNAPAIMLGATAVHPVLWGEVAAAQYDAHTHTTPVGPTSPPLPIPGPMAVTALSKQVLTS